MTAAEFEQRYRGGADPWAYRSSDYERAKYAATLAACGPGPFASALELGGSIGVFSAMLAPRCGELTTIDFAPSAVRQARAALRPYPQARAILGTIPGAIPDGDHDLVVASEVLYYLGADALTTTLSGLRDTIARHGRFVIVHWRPDGPERPQSGAAVHEQVLALAWLRLIEDRCTDDYLLHVLEPR